jgi:macrolide transport system ATP-binding/permease protein
MPDWSKDIRSRLENLRIDAAREADVVEELSQHLNERYDELKRGGASGQDAHRMALEELLAPDVLTERMRPLKQAQSPPPLPPPRAHGSWIASVWLDLRYAARSLRKQPRFAIAVVLTLALGIGANTAIFSLVNATLLARLPVPERERLAYVTRADGGTFAYPRYAALRDGTETLDGLAAWGGISVSMNAGDAAELVQGYIVTGNLFEVMGVAPVRGRLLTSADDVTPRAHPVVVISHDFWRTRFGGRDDVIGSDIRLNDNTFTVIGVAPVGFPGPRVGATGDLYVPMMMQPIVRPPRAGYSGEQDPDLLSDAMSSWLLAVARLKSGVSTEQARAELAALATNFARATDPEPRAWDVIVSPVDIDLSPQRAQVQSIAWLLAATVAAVLLIACANIANLLLTKAASRRLEFAVRLSMGATRARLVRQLLAESVLMSLAGGGIGMALAWALAAAFRAAPPPPGALPLVVDFAIDARVLAFTLAVSVFTGLLFGVVPALKASRPSLVPALKDSSFDTDDRGRRIDVKKPLVVAQVALSLMLLIAAGLLVRGLGAARAIDLGFDADRIVTAPLDINLLRYTTAQGREFYEQVVERVESLPGVDAATLARVPVMVGFGRTVGFMVEGREQQRDEFFQREAAAVAPTRPDVINANVVGPRFFETLGIELLRGRDFATTDVDGVPLVAVINEAVARRYFADSDPLGQRVSITGGRGPWRTIVGVVRDSKYADLGEQALPVAYVPLAQNHETGMTLYVRSSVPPTLLIGGIRGEIQALASALPVSNVRPMTDTVGTALYSARMSTWLLAAFGALALGLAAIGIYGVLSFAIASRTREIGIRLALGAGARSVFNMVVRDGLVLVAIGVVLGLLGALAAGRALVGFLYGVSPADVATFVAVSAILGAAALVACVLPARRAMRMDPMAALRYQ